MGDFIRDNYAKVIFNKFPSQSRTGGGKDTFGIYRHFSWKHPKTSMTICRDRGAQTCDECGMKYRESARHKDDKTCKKL